MAYDYDRLYRDRPEALGAPAVEVVAFFARYGRRAARVLDLGCGQGRDALMIARRGHSVTGVDLSSSGIHSMVAAAGAEALEVSGEVADIVCYRPDGDFDVILIDRTLHMLAAPDRLAVLRRVSCHVPAGGWLDPRRTAQPGRLWQPAGRNSGRLGGAQAAARVTGPAKIRMSAAGDGPGLASTDG